MKKSLLYLLFTFTFSWLLAGFLYWTNGEMQSPEGMFVGALFMFGPTFGVIIVQKIIYREKIVKPLGISFRINWWFLVAWLLMPVLAFAAFGVALLFPEIEYSPSMMGMFERYKDIISPEKMATMKEQIETLPIHPVWVSLFMGLGAGVTINAVAGFGEELGWRGFLQKEWEHLGFWKSSIFIGIIWGIWHAPLILMGHNYPHYPVIGVFMMTVWCILLAPIFSTIRIRAQSVVAAAILHGTLNATYGISVIMLKGGNELLVGMTGLAGFLVLLVVDIIIVIQKQITR